MKIIYSLILAIPLGACSIFGYNYDVKESNYITLKQEKSFELREYSSIVMATTPTNGAFDKSQRDSFQRLFDYISGENSKSQNISMTAPVLMETQSIKISMTTPVLMEPQGPEEWQMSFVLPGAYTLENAPKPTNPLVTLQDKKDIRFAVVRFSGFFNERNFQTHKEKLVRWMNSQQLEAIGPELRAGYNPPWTLPSLRRNEIMIPVR